MDSPGLVHQLLLPARLLDDRLEAVHIRLRFGNVQSGGKGVIGNLELTGFRRLAAALDECVAYRPELERLRRRMTGSLRTTLRGHTHRSRARSRPIRHPTPSADA